MDRNYKIQVLNCSGSWLLGLGNKEENKFKHENRDFTVYNDEIVIVGIEDLINNISQMKSDYDILRKDYNELVDESKYDLTYIASIISNEKKEKYPKLRGAYSLFKVCKENDINYGFKGVFGGNSITDDDIMKVNILKDAINLPLDLKNKIPGGGLINLVVTTKTVCHISSYNYISPTHTTAVYFNRKLITNSECVKLEPWYDERFVRIVDYDNLTNDDINWIKKDIQVKYQNKECLEPSYFYNKLTNMVLKYD